MFMACGVAAYSAAIFHLMTHAFFKALLFLSAGSVIHAMAGEQDMRNMGGLRKYIPWTFGVMAIATVAIAGIPPFAGFFSKDEILWKAYSSGPSGWIFWLIGLITALMTSFYMFRLLFMTFFGELRTADGHASVVDDPHAAHNANVKHAHDAHATGSSPHAHDDHAHGHGHHGAPHESPWIMLGPLVVLAVLSIVGGWIGWPHALGGDNRFEKFLEPVFERHVQHSEATAHAPAGVAPRGAESAAGHDQVVTPGGTTNVAERATTESHGEESTELALTGVSVAAGLLGLLLAWFLYVKRPELPARISDSIRGLYTTVSNKYYVDEGYYAAFVNPIVNGSRALLWRTIDAGLIDGTVNGAGTTARLFSDRLRRMQSGNIRSYAGWVALGGALVLFYVIWTGVRD
jgi:NADH-quinone oxidoreductase subunit L